MSCYCLKNGSCYKYLCYWCHFILNIADIMTFFRIFSEQENYFSCFFCVYIYYVLVDNMVSYRNKFYNVQTFQHSQFHELYIQTRIGIAFQPLILATNYKHIQTTTLALQTISNAAWIWYSSPIQFLQLNDCIQTKP